MPGKKTSYLQILLFILSLFSPISTICAFETYEGKKVGSIEIFFKSKDPDAIYDTRSVISRLITKKGDVFSQLNFDSDLKMLSNDYDKVEPNISVKNEELHIELCLWPRPIIHTITWKGNTKIKTKKLQKELDVKPLTVFNRQEFNKSFNKLKEYYIKKGYFESQLSYLVEPIEKTNQVDIQIDIHEGRSGAIREIFFEGFSKLEEKELREEIYTKKYRFLFSWITGSGTYREEILEQDKMSILNYLHNKGYADAVVDIFLEEDKKGKIFVIIRADRGELYHIHSVCFEGNTLLSDEEINKQMQIRKGDTFSSESIRKTAESIKNLYGEKGYIEANVYYETALLPEQSSYNIVYKIEEGQPFKIGLIRIFGNSHTKDNVILRESLLVPGELFDTRKLQGTELRLQAMGYFKSVNVYSVPSSDDLGLGPEYKDVYIEVEETTTGSISLFMGFSTTDNVNGGLELTERNFNIAGFREIFTKGLRALRGGGEYVHIRVNPGKRQNNYVVSWMTPYVRDSLWRLGVDVSKTSSRLQSKDYDIDTIGFSIYTSYPISNYLSFGIKYRFRNADADVKDKDSQPDQDVFGKNEGIISAASANFSYDSTNSIYKPCKGLRSNLEAEIAGIGGNFNFYKLSFINTLYVKLWSKGVMKFRGDIKFIDPFGLTKNKFDLSLSERFFLGGEDSVRGYKPYILGPHASKDLPLGGISSALLSAEYAQRIFKLMDGFIFIDAGSISFDRFSVAKLRASYGAGIRLELMNRTPIMIGYGKPINPERSSDEKRWFFSMAGQF